MATRLEQRIFRDILAEDIPFEEGQKALRDPEAWKTQMRGFKNENRYRTDFVQTPRTTVYWVWSLHRNAAGYFVGWKVTRDDSTGKETKSEIIGRRSKKRLAALMQRKAKALKAKFPDQNEISRRKELADKRKREAKQRTPRFSPPEFQIYCTIIDRKGEKEPTTHRAATARSKDEIAALIKKDRRGVPASLAFRYERRYRVFQAKWTKIDVGEFTL